MQALKAILLKLTYVNKLLKLALPLLLTACASSVPLKPAENLVSPNFRQPPAASLIVLLPSQVEAEDLEPGAPILMSALHEKLTKAGYKVLALNQENYETLWSQEVKEVGGIYDPHTGALRQREMVKAMGHLVQRVSAETRAELVIQPRLVLRQAEVSGMSAAWDGQQRRVPVMGLGDDTLTHSGSTLGLSVGLNMFAPTGELVIYSYGGALLPYRINVRSSQNEVRPDLFKDGTEVAEGVAIALKPMISK